MTPEVSVIIPTFNRRAMACEAVRSVLAQEAPPDFELIAVDDGSTDGTAEELQRLESALARPRAPAGGMDVIRTENRGVATARNRGVDAARAPLIAFLDSDDLWHPQKLARQFAAMRAAPGCEIHQTGELWMRDGRRVNPARRHLKAAGDLFIRSLSTCMISPSAVMMTADLMRAAGGFDELMAACEDYDLWLRILVDREAGLLDEPLVTRRAGHPGQLSATVPALDRFRIYSLAKLLVRSDLTPERRAAAADAMAGKCAIHAGGLKRRRRSETARFYAEMEESARRAWRLKPDSALCAALAAMRPMLARESAAEDRTGADGAPR